MYIAHQKLICLINNNIENYFRNNFIDCLIYEIFILYHNVKLLFILDIKDIYNKCKIKMFRANLFAYLALIIYFLIKYKP